MKQPVKTRFKDEIRRVLIVHALAPIGALVAIFLLGLALIWNFSLISLANKEGESLSALLQFEGEHYRQMLEKVAESFDFDAWETQTDWRVDFHTEIYSFLNEQEIRGDFYLLDAQGTVRFTTEHNFVLSNASSEQLRWFLPRISQETPAPPLRYCRYPFLDDTRTELQMGKTLYDTGGYLRGYVAFVLSETDFRTFINNRPVSVVVTNRYGNIFLSNATQFHTSLNNLAQPVRIASGYFSYAGEQYFLRQQAVLEGDLQVYTATDCGNMTQILSLMTLLSAAILLGVTAAVFISANTISRRKTQIIDEIVEAFLAAKEGRLEKHLHISTHDEFETIGETYNTMLDSLRALMSRNEEQARETALATIQQLESQFHPHFLFNTLETVRFMIRLDAPAADRMIVDLSKLLRYSVRYDENQLTLAEDIENTQSYLRILKCRFGERFHYEIDIPAALQDCRVPKLIFQPILENAVKYGMEGQELIHVCVRACAQDGELIVTISDDGSGILPAQLNRLRENLHSTHNQTEHIGLYNVHRRLMLLYGENFGLDVESGGCGKGTVVSLHFAIDRTDIKEKRGE